MGASGAELAVAFLGDAHGAQRDVERLLGASDLVVEVGTRAVDIDHFHQDGPAVISHAGFCDAPAAISLDRCATQQATLVVVDLDGGTAEHRAGNDAALDDEKCVHRERCAIGRAAVACRVFDAGDRGVSDVEQGAGVAG